VLSALKQVLAAFHLPLNPKARQGDLKSKPSIFHSHSERSEESSSLNIAKKLDSSLRSE
jgi:hypothetical protein